MTDDTPKKLGRPTKYKEEYNELVYNYSLLGATDEEIASFLGVCINTITNWKHTEEAFLGAIKKGKEEADANVVKSLYKRANGYITKETKTSSGGENELISITEKEVPPDTTAQIFWLKNRQPKKWRDKHNIEQITEVDIKTTPKELKDLPNEALDEIEKIMLKYQKEGNNE